MQFLIVTGMSGAGKTVAIRYLEDLGALCVDNLPPMMLVPFMEACQNSALKNPVIAIAADIRSGEFFDAKAVTRMIDEARLVGYTIDTLFIEASDDVLVNRYKETRREHPLSAEGLTLQEAIREERERLMPLRETATHLIDTTGLKPRALQKSLRSIVLSADEQPSSRWRCSHLASSAASRARATWCLTCDFCQTPSISRNWAITPGLMQTCANLCCGIR